MEQIKPLLHIIMENRKQIQHELTRISKQITKLEQEHEGINEKLNRVEAKMASTSFLNTPITLA